VLDLALLDQVLDRAGHLLDGDLGVDPVLVEQVDDLDLEPLEGTLGGLLDVVGPAGQAHLAAVGVELEAGLGGDHHLPAEGGQVIPDYQRLSAVLGAGRAGGGRASGPHYPGIAADRYRGGEASIVVKLR
jgi:hypothetical protein